MSGAVEIDGSRLSDALDEMDELVIQDAVLHSLTDERRLEVGEVVVERDDVIAIQPDPVAGGNVDRRVRTVRHMLYLEMGPYTCFGEVHTLPGVAPLRTLLVRRTMVPLTNCLVSFDRGGQTVVQRADFLVVNGNHISRVEEANTDQLQHQLAMLAEA